MFPKLGANWELSCLHHPSWVSHSQWTGWRSFLKKKKTSTSCVDNLGSSHKKPTATFECWIVRAGCVSTWPLHVLGRLRCGWRLRKERKELSYDAARKEKWEGWPEGKSTIFYPGCSWTSVTSASNLSSCSSFKACLSLGEWSWYYSFIYFMCNGWYRMLSRSLAAK